MCEKSGEVVKPERFIIKLLNDKEITCLEGRDELVYSDDDKWPGYPARYHNKGGLRRILLICAKEGRAVKIRRVTKY